MAGKHVAHDREEQVAAVNAAANQNRRVMLPEFSIACCLKSYRAWFEAIPAEGPEPGSDARSQDAWDTSTLPSVFWEATGC